jgi:peptidylprolyl isomerase
LRYVEVAPGSGALAEPRKCFFAHYTGWLTNGTKFDSSRDTMPNGQPRTPLSFAQGARRVIAGWDSGFEGMRVGGKRRLLIPYQLAYGELGRPPVIPPRSELIFDVELMAVSDTLAASSPPPTPSAQPGPRCPTWADVSRATR